MTTILDAQFGSDSEDSDYVLSESSSDEEEDEKAQRKLRREEKRQKERERRLQRVNGMFADMLRQSDATYRHPELRDPDDFMLQFQRRVPRSPKISTPAAFEGYLDRSSSRVFDRSCALDIRAFKQKCQQTPNQAKLDAIRTAVSVRDAEPATVKTTYKFAGATYECVFANLQGPRQGQQAFAQKKEKELGGHFAFLDDMYSRLGPAPTLSAVSKSTIDWTKFRDEHNLEASLKKGYHHLKEQAFLERATWNEYERQLRARRQG